jgi:hypothetical protein
MYLMDMYKSQYLIAKKDYGELHENRPGNSRYKLNMDKLNAITEIII